MTPTTVTVEITSEVSAQVYPNAYNILATSTPDVSLWQEIINYLASWI